MILVSLGAFVATVAVHVLIHRHLAYRWGIVTGKTIIVYAAAFLILAGIVATMPFPLTTLWLYALLVLSYLLYFLSFLSEGESPSAKILRIVSAEGPLSCADIFSRFTNEELFGKRLKQLVLSGFLMRVGDRFRVCKRGAVAAEFFLWYRKLLRWDWGG